MQSLERPTEKKQSETDIRAQNDALFGLNCDSENMGHIKSMHVNVSDSGACGVEWG